LDSAGISRYRPLIEEIFGEVELGTDKIGGTDFFFVYCHQEKVLLRLSKLEQALEGKEKFYGLLLRHIHEDSVMIEIQDE
jgi:hypothetical protein